MLYIYTLPVCPNCEDLKLKLDNNNVPYQIYDLEDDDVRIELLMDSVTLIEAPIVKIGNRYMNANDAIAELGIW